MDDESGIEVTTLWRYTNLLIIIIRVSARQSWKQVKSSFVIAVFAIFV